MTARTESDQFYNGITGEWTYTFVWPEIPTGFRVNNLRSMHHAVFAKHNAYWREAFADMAEGCDPLETCRITVDEVVPTRRLPDTASSVPAVKAAVDGIARHVLVDDSPQYVSSVLFNPPIYEKGVERLTITLVGPPREEAKAA
jgi:hypothetical protein